MPEGKRPAGESGGPDDKDAGAFLSSDKYTRRTEPAQTPPQILGPMFAVAYKWRNFHLLHTFKALLAKWERRTLWPTTTD